MLAAGKGSRMGELTSDKPKLFLEVSGSTIFEYQMDAVERIADSVTVVLGYGFDSADDSRIVEYIQPDQYDIPVDYYYLEEWPEVENGGSLYHALDELDHLSDTLLLCGDVIITKDLINHFYSEFNSDAYDGYGAVGCVEGVQDEMTGINFDDDGVITEYGKIRGHREVGVFALREEQIPDAKEVLADNKDYWFPVIFEALPSKRIFVSEAHQREINTPEHLVRAKQWLKLNKAQAE